MSIHWHRQQTIIDKTSIISVQKEHRGPKELPNDSVYIYYTYGTVTQASIHVSNLRRERESL